MTHLFPPPIIYSILTFICILIAIHGDDDEQFMRCSSPFNYTCGRLSAIVSYPFWASNIRPQYCGRQEFELKCQDNLFPAIEIGSQLFRILKINESHQLMSIARADILDNLCTGIIWETIINQNLFSYNTENVRNLSLFFDCGTDQFTSQQPENNLITSQQPAKNNLISCPSERGGNTSSFYTVDGYGASQLGNVSNSCSRVIKIPIQLSDTNIRYLSDGKLKEVLNQGFQVRYLPKNIFCQDCNLSQGICGSNQNSNDFLCLCRHHPQMLTCPSPSPAPSPSPSPAPSPAPSPSGAPPSTNRPHKFGLLKMMEEELIVVHPEYCHLN